LNELIAGFLIDECLSAELADMATERGYHALATNRMWSLRKKNDYRVASYAVDNNLILVTNDFFDLESIYQEIEIHPGIIFLTAGRSKLRTLPYQQKMFALALDAAEEQEPIAEAIIVSARDAKNRRDRRVNITLQRKPLPS
jgi:predicted nuclease of predicted toxin-antitoxin system